MAMTQSRTKTPQTSLIGESLDIARSLLLALLIVGVVRCLAYQPFTIPSSSMSPGLLTGDYILVSKYPYGWSLASVPFGQPQGTGRLMKAEPKRGDVVVFRLPLDPSKVWIKRVIGLPGDRVETRHGQVFLNGQSVSQTSLGSTTDADDPYRPVEAQKEQLPSGRSYVTYNGGDGLNGDNRGPFIVPAGHYMMMGDNRDNSLDGRWPSPEGLGMVPASHLIGRAERVLWSWKPHAAWPQPWTWLSLRGDRLMKRIE